MATRGTNFDIYRGSSTESNFKRYYCLTIFLVTANNKFSVRQGDTETFWIREFLWRVPKGSFVTKSHYWSLVTQPQTFSSPEDQSMRTDTKGDGYTNRAT